MKTKIQCFLSLGLLINMLIESSPLVLDKFKKDHHQKVYSQQLQVKNFDYNSNQKQSEDSQQSHNTLFSFLNLFKKNAQPQITFETDNNRLIEQKEAINNEDFYKFSYENDRDGALFNNSYLIRVMAEHHNENQLEQLEKLVTEKQNSRNQFLFNLKKKVFKQNLRTS